MYLFFSCDLTPAYQRSLKNRLKSIGFLDSEISIIGIDEKNYSSVRNEVNNSDVKGLVICGASAIKCVFSNPSSKCASLLRYRGFKTKYKLKNGNVIPCIITYDIKQGLNSRDENIQNVFLYDIEKVKDVSDIDEVITEPKVVLCKDYNSLKECAAKLKTSSIVGWDFETTGLRPYAQNGDRCKPYSIAFAFDDGTSYAIPLYNYFPTNLQNALMDLLKNFFYNLPEMDKVAHNTKFDLLFGLVHLGVDPDVSIQGKWQDTSLLCGMLDEMPSATGLKFSVFRYLGVGDWGIDVKNVRSIPLDDVLYYNALDSYYTLRLYQKLYARISKNEERKRLYNEILVPAMLQFTKIERNGVNVDLSKKQDMYNTCQSRLDECNRVIAMESSMTINNPKSPIQLERYFRNMKNYEVAKKTAKGGYSTDETALKIFVSKYKDKVAEMLLEHRALSKMLDTYILGMDKNIFDDGKIHGGYNLTATVTGRTSSSDPNMQNFPKRKGQFVRSMVVAPEGHKLCSFDYGQIEARLFAVVTGDETYLDDLSKNYDIHMDSALWIFHENLGWEKEKAEKMRSGIKNGAVFPAFYGAGAKGIAHNLDISVELAQDFKNRLFSRYKRVKEWQTEIVEEEQSKGFVSSLFGRRRRSPIKYNELLNFTCQSTASDMTLSAMNFLGRKYRIALMIHDDLSFYLPDNEDIDKEIVDICNAMLVIPWLYLSESKYLKAFAPLQVECSVGDNWGEQTEVLKISSGDINANSIERSVAKAKEVRDYYLSYKV